MQNESTAVHLTCLLLVVINLATHVSHVYRLFPSALPPRATPDPWVLGYMSGITFRKTIRVYGYIHTLCMLISRNTPELQVCADSFR